MFQDPDTNLTLAGRMSGNGGPGALDTSSVAIRGYSPGDALNFAVIGWSADLGSTWSEVEQIIDGSNYPISGLECHLGVSSVATDIVLAPAGGPYNSVWGPSVDGQIPGMTLLPYPLLIPEPAIFAFFGLGAAALAIFRRRN